MSQRVEGEVCFNGRGQEGSSPVEGAGAGRGLILGGKDRKGSGALNEVTIEKSWGM